jgi:hypothetical protein
MTLNGWCEVPRVNRNAVPLSGTAEIAARLSRYWRYLALSSTMAEKTV